MRRFFSFKSLSSSSGNSKPTPPAATNENVYWDTTQGSDGKIPMGRKVSDGSRDHKDSVLKPLEQYLESKDSLNFHHKNVSFSPPPNYSDVGEGNLNALSGNSPHHVAEYPVHHLLTPERYRRTKRGDLGSVRQSRAAENPDSPSSARGYHCSSGNSPSSSPIPLRCRSTRLQQINNSKTLDLYIDGEHQESNMRKISREHFFDSGNDGCLAENRELPCLGKPPRALSTAPSSPICSKENLRTYSFREEKDIRRHLYAEDCTSVDLMPTSAKQPSKKLEKLLPEFHEKPMVKSRDYDSETTTTIEDIYEDSSDPQPSSNSTGNSQQDCTDFSIPYENTNAYCTDKPLSFSRQHCLLESGSMGIKLDMCKASGQQKQNTNEELLKKVNEVEHLLMTLSDEDPDLEELQNSGSNVPILLQTIRKITEERRYLARELSLQIKCRIAERSSTKEGLKKAKSELDTRTRRLEKEKSELQSSLEKELDRRSNDWSLKLEKFQCEEQRLRERVRELAEHNVSLQREISSLRGNEVDARNRIMNSEMQLNELTTSLAEMKTENHNLHQALSELQERFNGAEEDRDCIRRSYKENEKENKELQKVVVRLQRVCSDQDKTITGLRQGYSDEIGKQSIEIRDNVSRLQMEQIRLTGVEQMLRKELESCRRELESLRHENMCLLDRLQGTGNGHGISLIKIDHELRARVDCLQGQGLSLLSDNCHLYGELLDLIKRKQNEYGQEANNEIDSYSIVEYTVKHQHLRRGIENFRRSLQSVQAILNEKSSLEELECNSQTAQCGGSQPKVQASADELELELKAETMLTKVLREKLCSKELELEQLQSDVASSVRAHDILRAEIQRLQDEISCLTHKTNDMELQVLRKDGSINQTQHDLQECTKELTATRGILIKVSEERDHMWEEVKCCRETIMLLNLEVKSLKKKIEVLDEDVLMKEGEISILKDSLVDKPFDTIYSHKSVKELPNEF